MPLELRREALWQIGDHLMPGRRAEVREITEKELAATQVLAVPLDRVSVKQRFAGVGDTADDGEDHDVWAGVLPVALAAGEPVVSAHTNGGASPPPAMVALAAEMDARAERRRDALRAVLEG